MPNYTVAKTIDLDNFISTAKNNGCNTKTQQRQTFIGNSTATNYPHIHVWIDGTIALSVGKSTNQKIGKNGEININTLKDACERFNVNEGALKNTFKWVFSAAS